MKYVVDVLKKMPDSANYNAWSKAPADVIRTLNSTGVQSEFIIVPDLKLKIVSFFIGIVRTLKFAMKLKKNDTLYMQRYGYYMSLLASLSKVKGVELNYIVHDLTFLRFGNKKTSASEIKLLKKVDVIFAHTEKMVDALKGCGVNTMCKVMHLFDYYSDDAMMPIEDTLAMKQIVAFAGNLDKSAFLKDFVSRDGLGNVQYRFYGIKKEFMFPENGCFEYAGIFSPSNTGYIKAGWGLLWDGNSVETCAGAMGEYLKINSSHKLSLYLACGLPLIVWSGSSLAYWLNAKGVCVLIDSLDEIPSKISELAEEDFFNMTKNARMLGEELRRGEFLKNLL